MRQGASGKYDESYEAINRRGVSTPRHYLLRKEEDENFVNAVDLLFKDLEEKDKNHFAARQYKKYKLAACKTATAMTIPVRMLVYDKVADVKMTDRKPRYS